MTLSDLERKLRLSSETHVHYDEMFEARITQFSLKRMAQWLDFEKFGYDI